jgi:hypothetical protein
MRESDHFASLPCSARTSVFEIVVKHGSNIFRREEQCNDDRKKAGKA